MKSERQAQDNRRGYCAIALPNARYQSYERKDHIWQRCPSCGGLHYRRPRPKWLRRLLCIECGLGRWFIV